LIIATLYVAAVARRPGEPLVIEEIMVAPPMPREVRIRIICSSICHIDLAFSDMQVSFFILHCLSKAHLYVFYSFINQ
jgi:Zn-dependent alcohol dehydrogenase